MKTDESNSERITTVANKNALLQSPFTLQYFEQ
jgi:hypothetical protein